MSLRNDYLISRTAIKKSCDAHLQLNPSDSRFVQEMSTLLSPKPGFCVKSSTLTPGLLPPAPSDPKILEPTTPIPIPKGTKVFINIAWDPNVPAPPPGSEDAIQRAMEGQDDMDETNPDGWYVPVIVSPPRRDVDKGMCVLLQVCMTRLIMSGSW